MPFDEDPDKWTYEQRQQLGAMCQRAHGLLSADGSRLTVGQALARAAAQMDLVLDKKLESAATVTLFRVLSSGDVVQAARNAGVLKGTD